MEQINVHQAKTHLSRLLEQVTEDEEVTIAKNDRPMARLVSMRSEPRRPGRLKGKIRMIDDFDDPLPEEMAAAFRGERP